MANFSKKIASTVSATAIIASAMSTSLVSAASEFLPYAEALVANNVIGAQSTEAGFRLNDQITRAELAKVAANLGQYTKVSCSGNVYADVNASLGDLCEAIETLASAGVINKTLSHFRPNDNVTRAEMTKMILGALGEKASTMSAGYADVTANLGDLAGFINRANELKCANTTTYFRPAANSSRGEAFKIASCAAKINVTPTNPVNPVEPTKPVVTNGSLTVSAVGNAVAQYVPANASSVKVGTVKFMATGGDATISSITIARSGLGNPADIESSNGIRLAHNGKIVTTGTNYYNSFDQKGNVFLSPALVLKNGESIDLDVLVSLQSDDTQNSQHQFAVVAVNNTNITPVTLGLINTTSYKATEVETNLEKLSSSVSPGTTNQRLVNIDFTPKDREVTITGFNITRANEATTANANNVKTLSYDLTKVLSNVKVYDNGTELTNAKVDITADKIFVTGLDLKVPYGRKTLQLRGDILLDSNSKRISLKIEDPSDVSGVETSTSQVFRSKVTWHVDIDLSEINTSFVPNVRADHTVAIDDNAYHTFFDAKLTSEIPVKVKAIKIKKHADTTVENAQFATKMEVLVNNVRVKNVDIAAITSDGVEVKIPHFIVDKNSALNIALEARFNTSGANKVVANKSARYIVDVTEITDLSNRVASIGTPSVRGHLTTTKGSSVELATVSNTTTNNVRVSTGATFELPFTLRAKTSDSSSDTIVLTVKNPNDLTKLYTTEKSDFSLTRNNIQLSIKTINLEAQKLTITLNSVIDYRVGEDNNFILEGRTVNADMMPNGTKYTFEYEGKTIPTTVTVGSKQLGVEAMLVSSGNNIATFKFVNTSDKEVALSELVVVAAGKDSNSRINLTSLDLTDSSNKLIKNVAVNGGKFTFDNLTQTVPANGELVLNVSTSVRFADDKFAVTLQSSTYDQAKDETVYVAK